MTIYLYFPTEKTLADGEFFLSVSYGGKDLYENQWKFCEMEEEEEEDRWIFCPYKPGSYSWVIDRKIPSYLPKVMRIWKKSTIISFQHTFCIHKADQEMTTDQPLSLIIMMPFYLKPMICRPLSHDSVLKRL